MSAKDAVTQAIIDLLMFLNPDTTAVTNVVDEAGIPPDKLTPGSTKAVSEILILADNQERLDWRQFQRTFGYQIRTFYPSHLQRKSIDEATDSFVQSLYGDETLGGVVTHSVAYGDVVSSHIDANRFISVVSIDCIWTRSKPGPT